MPNYYFSVIIPTLNEEKFLPKLLKDLEKQTFNDFEILIIDGGSNDKTGFFAEEFKKKLPIKLFLSRKKNVSYQRNYGAEKAGGKFLVFLDADTRIIPTFLQKAYRFIEKKKALVLMPYVVPDERSPDMRILFDMVNWLVKLSQMTNKPFSTGGSIIIEKNLFYLIGGFDNNLFVAEDHDLIQRVRQWGVKAKLSPLVKIKVNLRRIRREGRLMFFYKNLLASFHVLAKGKINKKIFDYPMGGGHFITIKKDKFSLQELNNYLKKIKKFIKTKL